MPSARGAGDDCRRAAGWEGIESPDCVAGTVVLTEAAAAPRPAAATLALWWGIPGESCLRCDMGYGYLGWWRPSCSAVGGVRRTRWHRRRRRRATLAR